MNRFISWKPDPGAEAIDAFTVKWDFKLFYAFPPFNIIGRVLKKVLADEASGILIVPYWPTQYWFSLFTYLLIEPPYLLFSRGEATISHPWRPLEDLPKTRWLAGRISAHPSEASTFRMKPRTSYLPPGGHGPRTSMRHISLSTVFIVREGARIPVYRI